MTRTDRWQRTLNQVQDRIRREAEAGDRFYERITHKVCTDPSCHICNMEAARSLTPEQIESQRLDAKRLDGMNF